MAHSPAARCAAALVLALAADGSRPALAQDGSGDLMTRARAEMAQLNYDAAIALLEQAETSGQNGPAEMAEIYRAVAESHAAMGRTDAAETAFRRLLALDPSVELPTGSSPKLTGPFTGAREFLAKRRLAVECRRDGDDAATLIVQSDPVDLVAGARLVGADGARLVGTADAQGQGRVALGIPAGAAATGCAGLDRHGNVVARADLAAAAASQDGGALGPATTVVAGSSEPASRPLYARWWLYGGAAALAGGVAVFYGLKMKSAEDELEELHLRTMEADHDITYADALEVEDRGKGHARNANIALVVTGVFAAVSGGLLVHQLMAGDEREGAAPGAQVGAGPIPGGAGVNVTLGF